MVALQAFADDSAAESGDKRLFLAGYISTVERWIRFSRAWQAELRRTPAIAYLKMSEAAGKTGQFERWSESDRNVKLLSLANIISDHAPWFIYCSVSRTEYNRILAPIAPRPFKNPYFSCFWGVISLAGRVRQEFAADDGPSIDFVFDEQGGMGREAVMWYGWLKEDQSDLVIKRSLGATPIFRDDKDVLPLQAADMLAWHLRRDHEYRGEDRPIKGLLMTAGAGIDIDRAALERQAKQMRRVPGVRFVQTKPAWRETKKAILAFSEAGIRPPAAGIIRRRWHFAKRRLSEAISRLRYRRPSHRP